ncbi:hypothetical protein Zmor_026088 [Zophobas morio]|uniref:Uncharacterized protein n=1 Tax=Zophobas morio TaxID=2755281 RepID=A0AA38M544_9CUCU|nr:hypothetical protein Zmor_026088 [Zophobas morio]
MSYVAGIGKRRGSTCMYCQENDDVEHTLFGWHKWHGWRHEVEIQVGRRLTADNLIEAMLEKVENWKLIVEYMRKIMTCKGKHERKEKEENAALRFTRHKRQGPN